jgi:hypothetical protein
MQRKGHKRYPKLTKPVSSAEEWPVTWSFPLTIIVTSELTLLVLAIFGFFSNSNGRAYRFEFPFHYFLNRGIPVAWMGFSAMRGIVPFPIVRLPFPLEQVDGVRIIDLSRVIPIGITVFAIFFFILSYAFVHKKVKQVVLQWLALVISVPTLILLYRMYTWY